MVKSKANIITVYVLLTIFLIIVLFPLYYAFNMSTLTLEESYSFPPRFIPGTNFFDNIKTAWNTVNLGRMLLNSTIVSFSVAFGKIILSILAAFAFTYFGDFKGKYFFFALILITQMLPVPVRIIPSYELMKTFGWVDTYYALTIPFLASTTGTLLFRQLFLTVPNSLADAAKIDGAGPIRFLISILVPLSKTNIGALFLIEFTYIWNQYLWPLIVTNSREMAVVQIGIKILLASQDQVADWNVIMAGVVIAMIPPLIVLLLFQDTLMKGFAMKEEK